MRVLACMLALCGQTWWRKMENTDKITKLGKSPNLDGRPPPVTCPDPDLNMYC